MVQPNFGRRFGNQRLVSGLAKKTSLADLADLTDHAGLNPEKNVLSVIYNLPERYLPR